MVQGGGEWIAKPSDRNHRRREDGGKRIKSFTQCPGKIKGTFTPDELWTGQQGHLGHTCLLGTVVELSMGL